MPSAARDHYATLAVERGASAAEIKAAYRRLALRYHPDRNPSDRAAEERFKEVSLAYAVLSDEDKRAHYDRFGTADLPFGVDADVGKVTDFFDAVFGDLFGLGRKRPPGRTCATPSSSTSPRPLSAARRPSGSSAPRTAAAAAAP